MFFLFNIFFSFVSISFLTLFQFTYTALFLSCDSITVVRTGSTTGDTGPTIILLKGEKKRPQFTNKLLEKHGLAMGSTIVMTPNAYMTYRVCVLVSKAVMKGYRLMPFLHDNQQLMVLEILDGFGSHERFLEAHGLQSKFLVLSTQ